MHIKFTGQAENLTESVKLIYGKSYIFFRSIAQTVSVRRGVKRGEERNLNVGFKKCI